MGGMRQFAQRHAGMQVFHLGDGHDAARPGFVDRLRFVGLHLEELRQA